jgi:malonyl CoA-acyl carrier protein transacylase
MEEEEARWQWKGFDDFLELGPGKTLGGFVRQIGTDLNTTYAAAPTRLHHHLA